MQDYLPPRQELFPETQPREKVAVEGGAINSLSFEYPVNRCFIIPRFVSHYSWKWISGSIIFYRLGEVWNLKYLAVHVHLRMLVH